MMNKINVDNLSLDECKQIKNSLVGNHEKSLAMQVIEENYFFMRHPNPAIEKDHNAIKKKVAMFLEELSKADKLDNVSFVRALSLTNYKVTGVYKSAVIGREIRNFYNEAIPVGYENMIFSYKRIHKKVKELDQNVINMMCDLAMKLKDKQNKK